MKKHLKTIQPVPSLFDKPAKDRILEASDKLFRILWYPREYSKRSPTMRIRMSLLS